MKSLADALAEQGERFPFPFDLPAHIYSGYLVILLAAPRVGKSLVGLSWAIKVAQEGLPVLYHSPDTDYATQAIRAVASLTGLTIEEIEKDRGRWSSWLREQDIPIRWSQAPLHSGNLHELVEAEAEYLGRYPAMIVVDVAMDVMRGEENVGNVRRVFRDLHNLGRQTGSVILALHHVKRGDAANGNVFVSMTDGLYGGEGVAEVVLTMWRSGSGIAMYLAKNRMGVDGKSTHLRVDYSRAKVGV